MTPSCHLLPTTGAIVSAVSDISGETTLLGPVNEGGASCGVDPWEGPVSEDPRCDPELLALSDQRNVGDHYRYWVTDAIREDLKRCSLPFEVAIENLGHDFNIGSVVHTANAFGATRVHIVGRRRWSRRGAMVTNRCLEIDHAGNAQVLTDSCTSHDLVLVGVDNVSDSLPLESTKLPRRACLAFGEESNGLSEGMIDLCECMAKISQRSSTRSMNVGHMAAIVMWEHARKLGAEQE